MIFSTVYQPMRRSEVGRVTVWPKSTTSRAAESDQNLQVFVVGGPFHLCLNDLIPTWTTNMLKQLISFRYRKQNYTVDVDDFFLMCAGKVMRGELTLSDQNVYQGARISLVGRLRGGMDSCEGKHDQGSNNFEARVH